MSSHRLIPLAAVLLIVAALAPPAQAQAEQKMAMRVVAVNVDETALVDGKLPVNTALHIDYQFSVIVPPLTVCPLSVVTVLFGLGPLPAFATGVLSVNTVSFFINTVGNVLAPMEYGPFTTRATVLADATAPSGALLTIPVTSQATPSTGTTGGCNLRASDPVAAAAAVQIL